MPAHLVHRLRDLVAGRPVRDDDVRDLAVARPRRDRHARADVRSGVRAEDLRAVDGPGAGALLREVADGRADELLLLAEVEVQALSCRASSTISRTPYPVPPRCVR